MEDIIIKYLDEQATSGEKFQLLEWLKESKENKKVFKDIQNIWLATDNEFGRKAKADAAFTRFRQEALSYEKNRKTIVKMPFLRTVAAAAILILICSTGAFLAGRYMNISHTGTLVYQSIVMGKDSKGSVELPDGSVVWLNTGSKITFPEAFDKESRVVKLEGEGYFDVVRNPNAPFYVESEGMKVNVLGTRFDMKNYAERQKLEIALLSGSVEVILGNQAKGTRLEPNQKAIYNKIENRLEIREIDAEQQIIWINDQLVFSNDKLADILKKVGYWYGIDVVCEGRIDMNQRMSLEIRNENKEDIFKYLSLIAPIRYEFENERVIIYPK